jgi:hypothetical protein
VAIIKYGVPGTLPGVPGTLPELYFSRELSPGELGTSYNSLRLDSTVNNTYNNAINNTFRGFIMGTIAANDLKTRGVSSISEQLAESPEAIITVRGISRYVVMDIEHYRYLRECELDAALLEAREDVKAGRVVTESVSAHLKRVTDGL